MGQPKLKIIEYTTTGLISKREIAQQTLIFNALEFPILIAQVAHASGEAGKAEKRSACTVKCGRFLRDPWTDEKSKYQFISKPPSDLLSDNGLISYHEGIGGDILLIDWQACLRGSVSVRGELSPKMM